MTSEPGSASRPRLQLGAASVSQGTKKAPEPEMTEQTAPVSDLWNIVNRTIIQVANPILGPSQHGAVMI